MGRQRVKLTLQVAGAMHSFYSHDETSRLCVETERCWTLAEDIILEWEQRKEEQGWRSRALCSAAALAGMGQQDDRGGFGSNFGSRRTLRRDEKEDREPREVWR